jgi:RNA polymerase sigma factor (sigma-70 family)
MTRTDARDDAALLAAAAYEPEAFAVFYRRYAEPVFAFFLTRTRRRDLSADLLAETLAAALEGAGSYRGTSPVATGWLFQIAQNKLVDSFRRSQVEDRARRSLAMAPLEFEDVELAELEERLDLAEHERRLEGALASLPVEQRAAVLARVVDERDYADIAADVSTSQAVVRKRVSRGLATLRERFSDEP